MRVPPTSPEHRGEPRQTLRDFRRGNHPGDANSCMNAKISTRSYAAQRESERKQHRA